MADNVDVNKPLPTEDVVKTAAQIVALQKELVQTVMEELEWTRSTTPRYVRDITVHTTPYHPDAGVVKVYMLPEYRKMVAPWLPQYIEGIPVFYLDV